LARKVADLAADHFGAVTWGVRSGLTAADALHGLLGPDAMRSALDGIRGASGGRVPKWSATLPRPAPALAHRTAVRSGASRVVYFPSCASRTMGAQRGDDETEALPAVVERLFAKAGFATIHPDRLPELCCGQPFESKGLLDAADRKAAELETALQVASDEGRFPIVFDTSPCAYRMKRYLGGRLPVQDSIEFIHDAVLPRVDLERGAAIAIHPVCSVRKMGLVDKLLAIAHRCSVNVVQADSVQCCGFAGDKGFNRPELNEHALRDLKAALPHDCTQGYSSSRTCEIGLSEQAGFPYRSLIRLVDRCAN
jgi:D-lactate dehydrogenase